MVNSARTGVGIDAEIWATVDEKLDRDERVAAARDALLDRIAQAALGERWDPSLID